MLRCVAEDRVPRALKPFAPFQSSGNGGRGRSTSVGAAILTFFDPETTAILGVGFEDWRKACKFISGGTVSSPIG